MKRMSVLLVAAVVLSLSTGAQAGVERKIEKEVVVNAPVAEVWNAWTDAEQVETWFARGAKIEPVVGGAYEIYFDPTKPAGQKGCDDCRVHSLVPQKSLVFTWNVPPHFEKLRAAQVHTLVYLDFEALGPKQTRVRMSEIGWGEGEEWDEVHAYFSQAWDWVFGMLERRFTEGPADWSKQYEIRKSYAAKK